MQIVFLIFALVVAFLAILFAVQNNDPASVHFLVWEYQGSLALILFVALAVGALIAFLVAAPSMIRSRMQASSQKKRAAAHKRLRQQVFLGALQTLPNFSLYYGHFLSAEIVCRRCGYTYTTHHEKMTDVNISVELMRDAFQDRFDLAFLLSADIDLVSPIRTVQQLFPAKRVISIFPPGRSSLALQRVARGVLRVGRAELLKSLFPDQVLKGSIILNRPSEWR